MVNKADGSLKLDVIDGASLQIAKIRQSGNEVAVVSSGAIACGKNDPLVGTTINDPQVLAAIGQPELFFAWRDALRRHSVIAGQFLTTHRMISDRETRKTSIGSISRFMKVGVPVFNELDCLCPEEVWQIVGCGDNDRLTYHLTTGCNAIRVIFLTGTDRVYHPSGGYGLDYISPWDDDLRQQLEKVGDKKNGIGSKVGSAQKIAQQIPDVIVTIAQYDTPNIITRIISGEKIGTRISTLPE